MGFGTFFIGYFLILNFAFYGFTDAIAAAIMQKMTVGKMFPQPEVKDLP